jgi:SprT-like protein
MTPSELEFHANKFLKQHFNINLEIPIRISKRMTSKLGAFKLQYKKQRVVKAEIIMSYNFMMNYTDQSILDVLYHECVHYALFSLGKPYKDSDKLFIQTLKKLGISETKTYQYKGNTYLYECKRCGYQFTKNMRGYEKRYICRYCKGHFSYKGIINQQ